MAETTSETTLWHRVLHDPVFEDLPFKIETNEHGQLILSPHKPRYSILQTRIAELLSEYVEALGQRGVEFAVETPLGVKVPDVVWISEERWQRVPEDAEASPVMPELCVEVLSESNTEAEISEKRRLYLDQGAEEVWTCDLVGRMRFYGRQQELPTSELAPDFPPSID